MVFSVQIRNFLPYQFFFQTSILVIGASAPTQFTNIATGLTAGTYTVNDLQVGSIYYFAITPVNALGYGTRSVSSAAVQVFQQT